VPAEKDLEFVAHAEDIQWGPVPIHLGQQQNASKKEAGPDQRVELAILEEVAAAATPPKGGLQEKIEAGHTGICRT